MRSIKLSHFLAFNLCVIISIILALTGFLFSTVYEKVVENDIQAYLIKASREIQDSHIVYIDNSIRYIRTEEGTTISTDLRSRDVSAFLLDENLAPIGTYGIFAPHRDDFQKILTPSLLDSIKSVISSRSAKFSPNIFIDGSPYELLLTPIMVDSSVHGIFVLAKQATLIHGILDLNNQLLLVIIPAAIGFSWMISYLMVTHILKPLKILSDRLDQVSLSKPPYSISLPRSIFSEVSTLHQAFTRLFGRISEVVDKQHSFVTNASHELRTPLTRAISSIDLMLIDSKNTTQKLKLATVKQDLFGLNQIIDGLLSLANIETPQTNKISKNIKLKPILDSIISGQKDLINQMHLQIDQRIDPNFSFYGSIDLLTITLTNIISNAIKYNVDRGTIKIASSISGHNKAITITNSTHFFIARDMRKIFDRFFRGSNKANIPGSGLGMSIARAAAQENSLHLSAHTIDPYHFVVIISQSLFIY